MREKIRTVIFYFILIQPFLDLYWFYHGKLADVLPFTLPTIIRILAVFVIFCMFFSQKQNWQKLGQEKWLICYLVLLVVYSALHLWHVKTFVSVDPNNYNYSTTSEIFYLIRMFLPLMMIYFTAKITFSAHQVKLVIEWLSGLFSGTIVLSNLFIISLKSYETGFISANIFEWFFNPNIGYSHIASKGFFNFTNMVGAVLFMLLPLILYYLFDQFDWKIASLNAVHALAMIELGTKVAAIGLVAGIIVGIIIYLVHRYLLKNIKSNNKALTAAIVIELASLAILPFGPAIQRYNYEIKLAKESDHDLTDEKEELRLGLARYPEGEARSTFLKGYIKRNYHAYALNKRFVFKRYSYKYDPEFWLGIMKEPGELRMQNRHLERAMLDQVVKNNNNKLDKFFGISYTRQNNIFNLERDFISQVYSLGWIGMLLFVGPYLVILLYGIIEWLRYKKVKTYFISSLLTAIIFVLAAAYSSGNVIDFLTASLIMSFIEGILLAEIKQKKKTA